MGDMVTPSIRQRDLQDEVMDDPDLDEHRHFDALRGLARLNWWSASGQILWRPIERLSREKQLRSIRVLDVATGGGDLPIWLWKKSQRSGIDLKITGLDVSERAVGFAADLAQKAAAEVQFERRNVLADALPEGYDVVISSLFLHHLKEDDAVQLIRSMAKGAEQLFLINDLLRHRRAWLLANVASKTFTRSEVVHSDAVQSVKAAFSWEEIQGIARRSEVPSIRISRKWPFRFLLEGSTDRQSS